MSAPQFQFFSDDSPAGALVDPDAWLIFDSPSDGYRANNLEATLPEDPYGAIDCFFDQFESGIIAGWLSYELGHYNHDLPTPSPAPSDPPLMGLAHFPESGRAISHDEPPAVLDDLESTVSREEYEDRVRHVRDRIRDGYVYQVNLSQRFRTECDGNLGSWLSRVPDSLRSPQGVYLRTGSFECLSFSPERFLRADNKRVYTEPIKGTRPRGPTPHEDDRLRETLIRSEKDRAEHAMIVDLERNDLNRVCEPGSVHVPRKMIHRQFPTVHHLISRVEGRLRDSVTPGELFRHTFPGGSITGAPKHTALRVIDRLESRHRGFYTGTIGWWDLDRSVADWNIVIRSLVRHEDQAWWDSGGGIMIDSDPEAEFDESLDKVALLRRLRDARGRGQRGTGRLRNGQNRLV